MLLGLLVLAGFTGCGAEPKQEVAYDQHEYFPVFKKHCNVCHPMDRPLSQRMDEAGWRNTVNRMRRHDPNLTPVEAADKIIIFLSEVRSAE